MNTARRLIARIDVKNNFVIKEFILRVLGRLVIRMSWQRNIMKTELMRLFYGCCMHYDRNSLSEIISQATDNIFIPIWLEAVFVQYLILLMH